MEMAQESPSPKPFKSIDFHWLRGLDLNQRPLGYEPNELPDCSTPHLDSSNHSGQGQTTRLRMRRHKDPGRFALARATGKALAGEGNDFIALLPNKFKPGRPYAGGRTTTLLLYLLDQLDKFRHSVQTQQGQKPTVKSFQFR